MKYFFLLSFATVFCFFGIKVGFYPGCSVWHHFSYNFQHAGIMHLVLNSIAFFALFRILELRISSGRLSLFILIAAFLASFAVHYAKPTVGASAMIYAMIGLYLVLANTHEIRIPKNRLITYEVCICISLFESAINPHSAFMLHLVALSIGLFGGLVRVAVKRK